MKPGSPNHSWRLCSQQSKEHQRSHQEVGSIIQRGPTCNVAQERAQCRWQTVCQKKEGGGETGGTHQEKSMFERKAGNRTNQNQKSTADRAKSRLFRQQGTTRCTLDTDLRRFMEC